MKELTLETFNLIVGTPDHLSVNYYFSVRINFIVEFFCDEYKEIKKRKAPEIQINFKKQLPTICKLEKQIIDHIYAFIKKQYWWAISPKPTNISYKIFTLKPY